MAPTKAERKQLDGAVSAFHAHYSSSLNWGSERWDESLYPALAQPTRYALLVNMFAPRADVDAVIQRAGSGISSVGCDLRQVPLPGLRGMREGEEEKVTRGNGLVLLERSTELQGGERCKGKESDDISKKEDGVFLFPAPSQLRTSGTQPQIIMSHWNMDAASALAVHMLDVQPGDRVLDLCAAPGGKSVALAQLIFPQFHADAVNVSDQDISSSQPIPGCLHANELDFSRNKRLSSNLHSYIPSYLFTQGHIRILRVDASDPRNTSKFQGGTARYDKILLDAPCSSERHIIHAYSKSSSNGNDRIAEEISRWRPGTSKSLAKTQAALLMTALKAVKLGGRIIYSTCSIEKGENDDVIEKVIGDKGMMEKERKKELIKWGVKIELGRIAESGGYIADRGIDIAALDRLTEKTEYGRIALPDHKNGGMWGPLYFCAITKTAR